MPQDRNKVVRQSESGNLVPRLAANVARLDPGSAAALRRGPMRDAGAAALWKLLADYRIDERWAPVIQAIAVLTPKGGSSERRQSAHDPTRPMGRALYEAKVSDLRLARLLNAHREARGKMAVRLCRRLSAAERPHFDLRTLAMFMLADSDAASRKIAREYYRAEAQSKRNSTESTNNQGEPSHA